jgi:hypothetical protein
MARYRIPPDPRDPAAKSDAAKPAREERLPIPWRWLGLGLIVTIAGIFLAVGLITAFLSREPLPVTPLNPTIIVLTAPPSAVPSATPILPTPTTLPTLTPVPTPDVAVAPQEVAPGFYAAVANTEGLGVTIRGGPSTNNVAVTVAQEGALLFVLDGPAEGNGYLWWQVRLEDGTEGWAAADFLAPAAAPEN